MKTSHSTIYTTHFNRDYKHPANKCNASTLCTNRRSFACTWPGRKENRGQGMQRLNVYTVFQLPLPVFLFLQHHFGDPCPPSMITVASSIRPTRAPQFADTISLPVQRVDGKPPTPADIFSVRYIALIPPSSPSAICSKQHHQYTLNQQDTLICPKPKAS